jgi:hypothetical protein
MERVLQVVRAVGLVRMETVTLSVIVMRSAIAAGVVMKEAWMVKAARVSMAAPVVRETGIGESQALSLLGVPVHISFFWAF